MQRKTVVIHGIIVLLLGVMYACYKYGEQQGLANITFALTDTEISRLNDLLDKDPINVAYTKQLEAQVDRWMLYAHSYRNKYLKELSNEDEIKKESRWYLGRVAEDISYKSKDARLISPFLLENLEELKL